MNTKKGWNLSQRKPGSAGCIQQHQFTPAESLSQNLIIRKKKACGSSTALVIALAWSPPFRSDGFSSPGSEPLLCWRLWRRD